MRERHSRCTQQGGEMHRMRRGAAQGKYQKASTKFKNKRIRNNKFLDLNICHYLTQEIKKRIEENLHQFKILRTSNVNSVWFGIRLCLT